MRHKVGQRKLQRTTEHRRAMLRNMVTSLLEHEKIRTTVPKAKEARPIAERMITLGKRGGLSNLRLAARTVSNKDILHKLFHTLNERYATRPGGYTRIVRLGFRNGDAAEMAMIELLDRPEVKADAETEGEGEGKKAQASKAAPATDEKPKKAKTPKKKKSEQAEE